MKTNQIMHRPFLNATIRQYHKTGYMNATDITEIYNRLRIIEGKTPKEIDKYFNNKETQEFIIELCNELNLISNSKPEDFTVYYKPSDLKKIRRGKDNRGTWLHPSLFIDYAMWLNPKFKAKVVIWVSDNLLFFRDISGDAYKELSKVLNAKFGIGKREDRYKTVARFIACKVLGSEDSGQWNFANQEQLHARDNLIRRIMTAAEFGRFESVDGLLAEV